MISQLESKQLDKETFHTVFTANLNNPNIYYTVAVIGSNVVGFISLHVQQLLHHNGAAAEIQELFVDPEMRGKGIGKALVNAARVIAQKNKAKVFEVSCNMKRERLINSTKVKD